VALGALTSLVALAVPARVRQRWWRGGV